MKISLIPAMLCMSLPIVSAEAHTVNEQNAAITGVAAGYTAEQQTEAMAKLKACGEQNLRALRGIKDLAGADAAATVLQESARILTEITPILGTMDQNEVMQVLFITGEQMEEEIQRLAKDHFYGSEALAKALTGSAAIIRPTVPLPDALKEQFIEQNAVSAPAVSGGPGYTQETAWILDDTNKDVLLARTRAHYASLILHKLNRRAISKANYDIATTQPEIVFANGKVYILVKYDLLPRGDGDRHILEQWLDITACSLITTEEEMQQYAKEGVQIVTAIVKQLYKVSDKNSADTAADAILVLAKQLTDKHTSAIRLLDDKQSISLAIENGIFPENDGEHIENIINANFFGSEKLEKAMEVISSKM